MRGNEKKELSVPGELHLAQVGSNPASPCLHGVPR